MALSVGTYGPKRGICNACGDLGLLTEDHTPPKACVKPSRVELQHIGQILSSDEPKMKGRLSQNGVKYRTLCSRCNNTLLGSKYDPAFIKFVNGVGSMLKTSLHLPSVLTVEGQPQAIIRSLLGHISAQGINRYGKGPHTELARDYFLDASKPLPKVLSVFYWAYPYRSHIMVRDAAYLDIQSGETFSFWLLKFFPIAFLITWDKPAGLNFSTHSFDRWRDSPFSTTSELPVTLRPTIHQFWPEAPTDHHVPLYGTEAISVKG
jgi:hypothetical protein